VAQEALFHSFSRPQPPPQLRQSLARRPRSMA